MKAMTWVVGILGVVAVICVVAVGVGDLMFSRRVKKEVKQMFTGIEKVNKGVVTEADLAILPEPVQKWLRNGGVVGKEKVYAVRLKQQGYIRTREDQPWMPFTAEQYYTTEPPAFVWYADVKPAPILKLRGRDIYNNGRGNMLIKLMSLIKVVDARGPEMDQGTLIRYLNEIMWFPAAALSEYIQWEPLDGNSARATMAYRGASAAAVFHFNENGDLVNFAAERYMTVDGGFEKAIWETPIHERRDFNGFRLPSKGEAVWKLASGDFSYIKIELTDIEYNNPELYAPIT